MENNNFSREKSIPEDVFTVPYEEFKEMFHVKHFFDSLCDWGIELSDHQLEQFYLYYRELVKWNTVINLTAITELQNVLIKHFLDSLSLAKIVPEEFLSKSIRVLDVGTGAGFPGIPLAIVYPDMQIVLMDSLNKRINFLNNVIWVTGLKNVIAIHSRAEELARIKEHRENYDLVCSRAVAELNCLAEYCLPFVKTGGYFTAYKSEKATEEIKNAEKALAVLGGTVEKTTEFNLPDSDYGRTLILIKKCKDTPKRYPRKAGMPAREPIV